MSGTDRSALQKLQGHAFSEGIFQGLHDHQCACACCNSRTVPSCNPKKYRLISMSYGFKSGQREMPEGNNRHIWQWLPIPA
ncbi:hypothetical protein [Polaromonas glacialis]|uniref:hypothetical protein n=1 Tax=Polaromonas glacialis TaxID=866564 RepID=UPI0012EC9273|nr:hypothetical protein [Polaromonas glacialis]